MTGETFAKPDFIGIGPPKTGTTWIYHNLLTHPQVEMPPDKEIRYFWERHFLGKLNLRERLTSEHWHVRGRRVFHKNRFRRHLSNSAALKLNIRELLWDLKYLGGNRTDKWYASLFRQGVVSGDITAKYCELPEEEIAEISRSFPALKILITLRDPVEREWSRAKMNLSKKPGRPLPDVTQQEFIDQFNDPPQKGANNYSALIDQWSRYFDRDQILVLFYDELQENPFGYFAKLCDFLDIETPGPDAREQLEKYVFKGVSGAVPAEFRKVLFNMHEEHITRLSDYLPTVDYPRNWLRKYQAEKAPVF
ncbi:MAG: sulfotransferase [Desulfocapsaceae bacterium]|jgi:hypothetical protein|nr:sulfotransferase [Desulfocapsaceae bacterium]